jgi:hypothetical protein
MEGGGGLEGGIGGGGRAGGRAGGRGGKKQSQTPFLRPMSAAGYSYQSFYVLYWYKSTNTDVERAAVKAFAGKLRELQMQIQIRYKSRWSDDATCATCAISFRSTRPAGGT